MMINYIRLYFEPKSKELRQKAFDSAKEYFKGKQKTITEFQAYQRGYVNAYRHTYATTKLEKGVV